MKVPEVDLSEFQIPTIAEICALIDSIEPGPLPTEEINLDWLAEELAEKIKHLNLPTKERSWDSVWAEINKISGDELEEESPTAVGQAIRLPWSTDRFPATRERNYFTVEDFLNREMIGDSLNDPESRSPGLELKFLEES